MKKIVIFGGTLEGRQLAEVLRGTNIQLHICVTTDYAKTLIPKGDNIQVLVGRMDCEEMIRLFENLQPELCIDATHPYAVEVTQNIQTACNEKNIFYIRLIREDDTDAITTRDVCFADSVEAAVEQLSGTKGKIFITTGSKELEQYTKIPDFPNRCIARVLSTPEVLEKCAGLGFCGENLIAMQGPFSMELNEVMFRESQAEWLVTKSSGSVGGYTAKCEAAIRLGMHLMIIGRPSENAGVNQKSLSETLDYLKETYGVELQKPTIYLVSMGPGNENLLTKEARDILKHADVFIGAKRMLGIFKSEKKPCFVSYKKEEIIAYIKENPQYQSVALCYSGDIGFYSGAKSMQEMLKGYEIKPVSGISSVTYFLNKIGVPWEDVVFASCHGRTLEIAKLLQTNRKACVILGDNESFHKLCRDIIAMDNPSGCRIISGSRLSYEDEKIVTGSAEDFLKKELPPLSLVYIERG